MFNRISGHAGSATRERICQDPKNERVPVNAADALRGMRAFLAEAERRLKNSA